MRLTELNPRWIARDGTFTDDSSEGCGVAFDCPGGCGRVVAVHFDKPLDGGPSLWPAHSWQRLGDSLETLTLQPSILKRVPDGNGGWRECWHGFLTNGEVTTC